MQIRPLEMKDLSALKSFADLNIGQNYFSDEELIETFHKSQSGQQMCSFILEDASGSIHGIRLAYPPGGWTHGKGQKLRPELWQVPLDSAGYFQSLFLSNQVRGQGWGPKLSEASIEVFKKLGAKAIVTHAWKESPDNSSLRYLTKIGFQEVATHAEYWVQVDYECVLDGKPCRCTAVEMIKYI